MTEGRTARALPTVTGFAAKQAISALRKRGIAAAPLLRRTGLSERALAGDSDAHPMSALAQAKVLDFAAEAMEDSAFGLHLALQTDPRDAGIFFYVASGAKIWARRCRYLRATSGSSTRRCASN